MTMNPVQLDGSSLTLAQIRDVGFKGATVELAPHAIARIDASRALVEKMAESDAPTYGINTGFGTLSEIRIDRKSVV